MKSAPGRLEGNRGLAGSLVVLAILAGACGKSPEETASVPAFTPDQLAAVMPADLGASSIDVSGYPSDQRENYELFVSRCGQCHTPARPINSPLITREDWGRYVERMRARLEAKRAASAGARERETFPDAISGAEAGRIVNFLVHDARLRKVERAQEFKAEQARLAELFARVREERKRRGEEIAGERDQGRYTSP